jgi:glycine oxidase
LTGTAVRNREPQLGPNVSAAIYSPFGHRVNSKQVVLALQQAFLQAGGVLYQHTPVIDIVIEHQTVQAVQLAHKTLATKAIINAAGAWSSQFASLPAGLQNLIEPLKGQTITMQMPPQQPLIQRPIIGPVYLVPHSNGKLVLGTTVEEGAGFDTRPTSEGVGYILAKALEIVPGIKKLPIIEKKVGLRPTGPGRLPVLGPTAINGLIMASGGHSYGILLTPLVAHGIRQLVTTGQIPDTITPFLPTF